jgi:fatty acid desaturase
LELIPLRSSVSARAGAAKAKAGAAKATPYVRVFALAAIPTALTLLWEWGGMGTPSNLVRFTTALPLGAAVMWVLLQVTSTRESIG